MRFVRHQGTCTPTPLVWYASQLQDSWLLCRWDLAGDDKEFTVDKGWGSTWVKIVASWLCAMLYLWSMVAHRVVQGRSFY